MIPESSRLRRQDCATWTNRAAQGDEKSDSSGRATSSTTMRLSCARFRQIAITRSASTYVVVRRDGHREILYGVSVFVSDAFREEEILARFPQAPVFSRATVGNLRRAGFDLWATGSNPRHYEVQLLPGHLDGEAAVPAGDVRGAAARLLQAVGELLPNPGYAG
jgi:hypothetical protein